MSFRKYLLLTFLVTSSLFALAQPPLPDVTDQDPGGPQGAVPVDAGLGLLLAAGAGYGVKKVYDYKKKMRKSESEKS